MSVRRYLPIGVFILVAVLLQLLLSLTETTFLLTQLTMAAYYALVALGLCLLMGYAGQISMGHAGFYGIGAYIQAVLTTTDLTQIRDEPLVSFFRTIGFFIERQNIYEEKVLSVSPWIALAVSVGVTIVIAFLIGKPVLKLKGHYLAMATLGFGIIIHALVVSINLFGLADGISGVPSFPLLPGVAISGDLDARVGNFYIAVVILALCLLFVVNLIHSRVGRALRAIHGNEQAASSLGINAGRYKLLTFVMSAVLAALGGAFLVHYNAAIGPSDIDVMKSVRFVAIVAAGGMDSIWGVLSMGFILNFISLRQFFGSFDDIFFAVILIVIMLFLPQGLIRWSYFTPLRKKILMKLRKSG